MARARAADSIAEQYHQLTKYSLESLERTPTLDWSRQPDTVKEIVSSRRVALKPYLPFPEDPLSGESPVRPSPSLGTGVGIAEISRALFFSGGITGLLKYEGGEVQPLRAAPSAGALYPTEIYVAVRDLPEIDAGLYHYQVKDHSLALLWEGDQFEALRRGCRDAAALREARVCFLFTGKLWRSAWRYQERGYRRVLLDAGHVLGNLVAYAPHESCTAVPILSFCDAALNRQFFFDEAVEPVLACAALIPEVAGCPPGTLARSGATAKTRLAATALQSEKDLERSATLALHRASSLDPDAPPAARPRDDAPRSARILPLPGPGTLDAAIPESILRRRSARRFGAGAVQSSSLGAILGFAFGRGDDLGAGRPVGFATREAGLLDAHVVVLQVDGLDPGVYRVEGAGEALLPVAYGSVRRDLLTVALGQEIGGTCAAAMMLSAPAREAVQTYGDRAYRYLHLEAGHCGERFQLAATALHLGACGIGGFLDDDASALVDRDPEDWVLYLVALGPAASHASG